MYKNVPLRAKYRIQATIKRNSNFNLGFSNFKADFFLL